MGTRPGKTVTRVFIGGGGLVYSIISVLRNEFLSKPFVIKFIETGLGSFYMHEMTIPISNESIKHRNQ